VPVIALARTVNAVLDQVGRIELVRKADLRCGDQLLVITENSVYLIQVHGDATYSISGGWFDHQGLSPARISISGCTWGGSVIKCDIVAACGLRLEFGNRVVTSRIREVRLVRDGGAPREVFPPPTRQLLVSCYGPDWRSSSAG
jgi:hypothetical protein